MAERSRVIFVDVDDTLMRSVGPKRIPMPSTIKQVKELHAAGHTLFLWSSGGADYAQESAKELGIEPLFQAFLPRPDIYIDDQSVADWRYCQHVLQGRRVRHKSSEVQN